MGFQFPTVIWNRLSGSEFRFIEQLSFLRPDRGWVYVGRDWLAKKLGVSRDQISRITSHLVQLGVLEKFQRRFRRKDGRWDTRPCCYRLVPWVLWKMKQLTQRLFTTPAGLRSSARTPTKGEKRTVSDPSFLPENTKEPPLNAWTLQKMPLLKQWIDRGKTGIY